MTERAALPTAQASLVTAHGRAEAAATAWPWRHRPAAEQSAAQAAALRKRGVVGGLVGLVAAALVALWRPEAALVVAAIAAGMTTLALVSPLGAFRRVTALLERFGHGVGVALTWLLMGITYYLLFLPVGLLLRATGKLRLEKRLDPARTSYWRAAARQPAGLDHYRRQF